MFVAEKKSNKDVILNLFQDLSRFVKQQQG